MKTTTGISLRAAATVAQVPVMSPTLRRCATCGRLSNSRFDCEERTAFQKPLSASEDALLPNLFLKRELLRSYHLNISGRSGS